MTVLPRTSPPPGISAPGHAKPPVEYEPYLRLPDVLGACRPVTGNRAEPIFIRLHQICELQFASILDKLEDATVHLTQDDPADALQALRGCQILTEHSTELLAQFPQLVPPDQFHDFRPALVQASGIASVQFRRIEEFSGCSNQAPERCTLWSTFLSWAGIGALDPSPGELAALLTGTRAELAHAVRHHDLGWMRWRRAHAAMAETMIGDQRGTAGTSGVAFLRQRARLSWYPGLHIAFARLS